MVPAPQPVPHSTLPRHVRLASALDFLGQRAYAGGGPGGLPVDQCVALCRQASQRLAAGALVVEVDETTQRVCRVEDRPVVFGACLAGMPAWP